PVHVWTRGERSARHRPLFCRKRKLVHLLSVNIGKSVPFDNNVGKTAIFKQPQTGPVAVHELGLTGDEIADLKHHGGLDQAVYLYGQPDYDWWESAESRPMTAAMFGENLTIAGL